MWLVVWCYENNLLVPYTGTFIFIARSATAQEVDFPSYTECQTPDVQAYTADVLHVLVAIFGCWVIFSVRLMFGWCRSCYFRVQTVAVARVHFTRFPWRESRAGEHGYTGRQIWGFHSSVLQKELMWKWSVFVALGCGCHGMVATTVFHTYVLNLFKAYGSSLLCNWALRVLCNWMTF